MSIDQGHAARSSIVRVAANAADSLGTEGLQFVVRNFGLIDPAESDAAAERVGWALWRVDPKALFDIRSDPARGVIAERAIVTMPPASLLEGITSTPTHLVELLGQDPIWRESPGCGCSKEPRSQMSFKSSKNHRACSME